MYMHKYENIHATKFYSFAAAFFLLFRVVLFFTFRISFILNVSCMRIQIMNSVIYLNSFIWNGSMAGCGSKIVFKWQEEQVGFN